MRNGDAVISRCTHEGAGFIDINGSPNGEPRVGNILIDQNVLIAVPNAGSFGKSEVGALTWRNCLHVAPNVADTPGMSNLISIIVTGKNAPFDEVARLAEPIRIYSNSFVMLDDSSLSQGPFLDIDDYTNFLDTNNVIFIDGNPGFARHEEIAPFDGTVLWSPRYLGRREWTGGSIETLRTQYETPAGTISLYRPLSGSGITSGTMGEIAFADIQGRSRSAAPARGAVQP